MKNYVKLMVALVFATNLMAQNVPNYVPTNGLVGWWPFNGNANDESGNGNHGTVNGATLTTDRNGKVNSAYSFNGINQNITKNNFSINNGALTISFWLNTKTINKTMRIITHNWDNSQSTFSTHIDQKSLIYGYIGGVTKDVNNIQYHVWSQNVINSNQWYFITCTFSDKSNKIYIDGNLINSITTTNLKSAINTLFFGGDSTWPFNGILDDIAIYNRALTQEEITALYSSTPPCTIPTVTITPQGNTTFCQGGFVNLNASTGANYTYEWYNNGQLINGANSSVYQATTSGNYTVKVIDGACNATSAATMVTVNPLPNVTLNALNQFTLKNATPIQLVASPTGGTFSGEGVQGATFTPANVSLGKKTITYNYTSPQGCSGKASIYTIIADTLGNICSTYDTLKVKLKLTTGIKANQYTTMNVYPNPTSDVIIIEASDVAALNGYTYKLVDLQGKEVYNALVTLAKTEVSLKSFGKAGVYVLHVVDANNASIETRQIVLQ